MRYLIRIFGSVVQDVLFTPKSGDHRNATHSSRSFLLNQLVHEQPVVTPVETDG